MTKNDCMFIDCEYWDNDEQCPFCRMRKDNNFIPSFRSYIQSRITPEQYLERTGEKYPDAGMVWYNWQDSYRKWSGWLISRYEDTKGIRHGCIGIDYVIYCIIPPLPPEEITQ